MPIFAALGISEDWQDQMVVSPAVGPIIGGENKNIMPESGKTGESRQGKGSSHGAKEYGKPEIHRPERQFCQNNREENRYTGRAASLSRREQPVRTAGRAVYSGRMRDSAGGMYAGGRRNRWRRHTEAVLRSFRRDCLYAADLSADSGLHLACGMGKRDAPVESAFRSGDCRIYRPAGAYI